MPGPAAGGLTREGPAGARARFTDRLAGDLAVGPTGPTSAVAARRRAQVDLPWTWLRQCHGDTVEVVAAPGASAGRTADAAVTAGVGTALAVHTADCAPVALWSPQGLVGAVHAGWRGLAAGVVERAVSVMCEMGASNVEAVLGPCIHHECYEFGLHDLDTVADRLGEEVRSSTAEGAPALDLVAAVRAALARSGVSSMSDVDVCTGCSPTHFSHRVRRDTGRQALVVWREPT